MEEESLLSSLGLLTATQLDELATVPGRAGTAPPPGRPLPVPIRLRGGRHFDCRGVSLLRGKTGTNIHGVGHAFLAQINPQRERRGEVTGKGDTQARTTAFHSKNSKL